MSSPEPSICEVGGKGLFLPLGRDGEQEWPTAIRVILYGMGLGWLFLGVAIVADKFMGAIECITAKKVRKYNAKSDRHYTVEVWNPTVANLTLMALGSSAPEILLSVIELLGNELYSGDLGPSTIVGSAAFNLLCIIAVCVMAIPEGECRKIKEMPVYVVTAMFSIFAYLWLLVILLANSENVVEPWEGVITFLFFPLLVFTAFLADRGYFSKAKPKMGSAHVTLSADMSKEELAELDARIRKEYGPDLTTEQVSKIALIENNEQKTRAQYRVAATRALTGSKRVQMTDAVSLLQKKFTGDIGEKLRLAHQRRTSMDDIKKVMPEEDIEEGSSKEMPKAVVEFAVSSYAVMENAGSVKVVVTRHSKMDVPVSVQYVTRDGQAKAVEDYIHQQGTLEFGPGEDRKLIEVAIVDDVAYEDDEEFFIDLYDPKVTAPGSEESVEIGPNKTVTVVIIDDDLPGVLGFSSDTLRVPEELEDQEVTISVARCNGCSGKVTCKYYTESAGALEGKDYDPLDGILVFEHGETVAKFKVNIKARGRYDRSAEFRIILGSITGGARFDAETDGGAESCILTVFIESEQAAKDRVDRLMSALAVNWDKAKVGHANWAEQFRSAIYVNGGDDDEEEDAGPPSVMDWVLHVVTLPWKLLFALVPPTDFCGGWACFVVSLIMIGLVTAVINDMASLFGCVMTIPKEVTAITFVALGTSLPDTFASMVAAQQDAWADASIGNVTGSNSVNVFLGLGLPWMIGAIYWRSGTPSEKWIEKYADDGDIPAQFRDGSFVVKAGTLSFSVAIFCGCAAVCIVIIYIRRTMGYGELGGPKTPKYITSASLVGLWCLYIGLSSWKSVKESNA